MKRPFESRTREEKRNFFRETFLLSAELRHKIRKIQKELEGMKYLFEEKYYAPKNSHVVEVLLREEFGLEPLPSIDPQVTSSLLLVIAEKIPNNNDMKHGQIQLILEKDTSKKLDEIARSLAGEQDKRCQKAMLIEIIVRSKLGMPFYEHPTVTRLMDLQERIEDFVGAKAGRDGRYQVCEA